MPPINPPPIKAPKLGEPAETKSKIEIPEFTTNSAYLEFFRKQRQDPKVGSNRFWDKLIRYCEKEIRSPEEIKAHIAELNRQRHLEYVKAWERRKEKGQAKASSSDNPPPPREKPKTREKIPVFKSRDEAVVYFHKRLEKEENAAQKTRMRKHYNFALDANNDVTAINKRVDDERKANTERERVRVQKKRDAEKKDGGATGEASASARATNKIK